MSEPFEEIIQGETTLRFPPGLRHELICARLHSVLQASVANFASTRLLEVREAIHFGSGTTLRPDLALVATATNKLWLAIEVVNSEDHHVDTVTKKEFYESIRLPRLWMVDPRYHNVELYHASQYGMRLDTILAERDVLTEKLLPEFELSIAALFAPTPPANS